MELNDQSQARKEAETALEARDQTGYQIQPESLDDLIEWEAEAVWPDDEFKYFPEHCIN